MTGAGSPVTDTGVRGVLARHAGLSRWLPWRGAILRIQPALDWTQRGRSAWINALKGQVREARP